MHSDTPRVDHTDLLYEHFKRGNWWARHPNAWRVACYAYLILMIALTAAMKMGNVSSETVVGTTLGFIPFFGTLGLIKYFCHDKQWRKFREAWNPQKETCSTNIGGVVKIYD